MISLSVIFVLFMTCKARVMLSCCVHFSKLDLKISCEEYSIVMKGMVAFYDIRCVAQSITQTLVSLAICKHNCSLDFILKKVLK